MDMSSIGVYYGTLVATTVKPIIIPHVFYFIFNYGNLYAVDNYGNLIAPFSSTRWSSTISWGGKLPSSVSFTAAFYYPWNNFYLLVPFAYPLVISFDYPVRFISINMSTSVG